MAYAYKVVEDTSKGPRVNTDGTSACRAELFSWAVEDQSCVRGKSLIVTHGKLLSSVRTVAEEDAVKHFNQAHRTLSCKPSPLIESRRGSVYSESIVKVLNIWLKSNDQFTINTI